MRVRRKMSGRQEMSSYTSPLDGWTAWGGERGGGTGVILKSRPESTAAPGEAPLDPGDEGGGLHPHRPAQPHQRVDGGRLLVQLQQADVVAGEAGPEGQLL